MNIRNMLSNIEANNSYTQPLEIVFAEYQFNNNINQTIFIIQYAIKSDNFYFIEESFNDLYKLMHTFKSIYEHKAMQLINNYNNDSIRHYLKKNGTTEEKERFLYRERGINRLLGKENYKRYAEAVGIDLINCPRFASNKFTSARIAMEFWNINKCDNKINNIEELTKTVQGNLNDIDKVKEYMKVFKIY